MGSAVTIAARYYRLRSRYWRLKRLLFPSPAEVRFMVLMGARCITIDWLRGTSNRYPLIVVWSRGKVLRRAKMKREVRYGRYYVDFANDLNWIIEIDGTYYHQDVVQDMDREIHINEMLRRNPYGMRLLRIPAPRLWHDRARVQRDVLKFLTS